MTHPAISAALGGATPPDERADATAELHRLYQPSSILTPDTIGAIFEIAEMGGHMPMMKAVADNVVPFPSRAAKEGKPGMQSVRLDDWVVSVQGDWQERRGAMSCEMMRAMVDQTPVLNAVVMTRVRQIQRFCRVNESGEGPGFCVRHIDKDHKIIAAEKESITLLHRFLANCGWEFNPRRRKALHRDSFAQFMGKLARDSLILDSAAIETEQKKQRNEGIDGLYAVDGGTIRLCTENGYEGQDEIFALQVVSGRITAAYTYDDLVFEPRNPRSDVISAGYGLSEVELMVRVVTGFLNAMTLNIRGFDSNSIPKGMLHLSGNYSQRDLEAFKRYWRAMVRGVDNAWELPVMVSSDQESKASFERFGIEFNEMYFAKWMTFLTSIICAIYGMSPSEINFDSFTGGNTSALAGSDTAEKLAASKDSGLRPILSYFEGLFTDYIVGDFSEKYVFRWTGLDDEDRQLREDRARLVLTVNEMRAQEGYDSLKEEWADAPLNPSLVGPWLQMQQAAQGPDAGPEPGPGQEGGDGQEGESDDEPEQDSDNSPDFGRPPQGADFGKSFGESMVYRIGAW